MHEARSRVIIVVVLVGAVKIYTVCSSSGGAQKKKKDETQFTTKIGGKTSLGPSSYFLL
jgi:hypothetical protein